MNTAGLLKGFGTVLQRHRHERALSIPRALDFLVRRLRDVINLLWTVRHVGLTYEGDERRVFDKRKRLDRGAALALRLQRKPQNSRVFARVAEGDGGCQRL